MAGKNRPEVSNASNHNNNLKHIALKLIGKVRFMRLVPEINSDKFAHLLLSSTLSVSSPLTLPYMKTRFSASSVTDLGSN